jgi:hypothetical protein
MARRPAPLDRRTPHWRDGTATFSVEAFALRVQALIADDRALMERLIRFAQAHDLLKKNAERAQKLAQDSNAALETYQRRCARSRSSLLARTVCTRLPSLLYCVLLMCVLDRNSLTSLLRRSLRSRSARPNRQRRSASSQRQTRRCPRARCSSRRMQRQRRRSCVRQGCIGARAGTAARFARGDQPRANGKRDSATAAAYAWETIARLESL